MRTPSRRGARGAAACASLALAGCLSGPAPVDHFYRLEVAAPGAPLAAPALAGTLEVERPRADAVTNQRSLLYRHAEGPEIHRHAYHRWADPPTTMVQVELAEFLREAGAAKTVVTPEMRLDADYRLTGRIARLERLIDGGNARVVVELELNLTDGDGNLLLQRSYRDERRAEGDGVAESVLALDGALGEIFQRFLADLDGIGA